jgi:hypothetical protein
MLYWIAAAQTLESKLCTIITPTRKKKQSVTQKWQDSESGPVVQNSLGNFTRFDGERCRWRVENGDASSSCTTNEYGHPRRRGWVNLRCNPDLKERARLVAVNEVAACDFELTVESPSACPPAAPPTKCNEERLRGATANGSFVDITKVTYDWIVEFNQVRERCICFACPPTHTPLT